MAEGWCKFHRPLLSHALWLSEPFTRGQAFVDLFANAGHRPSSIRVRGIKVDLERGQLGFSELTLAERWKWSRGKVRRFLRELENDQMLAIKQDNKTTIITILNYDKYQGEDFFCDTANETAGGTPNGHQTDTIKNVKNEKNQEKNINRGLPTCPPETWERYLRFSRGFHQDKQNQLGRIAPMTDAKIQEGAKALDNLIRVRGFPEAEVVSVLGWSIEDNFWKTNLRSIASLLKKSSNGDIKYLNVLAAMNRDIDHRVERGMEANG